MIVDLYLSFTRLTKTTNNNVEKINNSLQTERIKQG